MIKWRSTVIIAVLSTNLYKFPGMAVSVQKYLVWIYFNILKRHWFPDLGINPVAGNEPPCN